MPSTSYKLGCLVHRKRRVDRDAGRAGHLGKHSEPHARAAWKRNDRNTRPQGIHSLHDQAHRIDCPALEFLGVENTGPAIEYLHGIGAGINLADQIGDRRLDQYIHQTLEPIRVLKRQAPRRDMLRRSPSGNHIGRNRPRRPAKADHRLVAGERFPRQPHSLEDGPKLLGNAVRLKRTEVGGKGRQLRALALLKMHTLPKRVRNNENVGEDDRGIEIKPPHRLQRHLGREFRRKAELKEGTHLLSQLAVFWKVAPGLPHQPDRRRIDRLASENPQQFRALAHAAIIFLKRLLSMASITVRA